MSLPGFRVHLNEQFLKPEEEAAVRESLLVYAILPHPLRATVLVNKRTTEEWQAMADDLSQLRDAIEPYYATPTFLIKDILHPLDGFAVVDALQCVPCEEAVCTIAYCTYRALLGQHGKKLAS